MGAKEFISKPSNIDDLVNRIKTIVRAHTAEANIKNLQVEFTSKLLHDLLTPLHTIKSAIDYIESEVSEQLAEQHKNVFRGIEKSIQSMDALLNDMIDLSLFESGKVDIEKLPANLDELIPVICTQFFPRTNAKRIEMLIQVNEAVPTTPLDTGKIEQVMQNLLDNAIKFTPEGGTIKIQVRPIEEVAGDQKREFVEVVVSDTGAGIAPEELLFIFDKYKNFLTGKTSQQKTTGLGLVICQSIVEAHGGKMSAESALGGGSRFKFMLPADSMN
jgi:signal transduction histidine kinase